VPTSLQFATATIMGLPFLAILILNLVNRKTGNQLALGVGIIVAVIQMISAIICAGLLWANQKDFIDFSIFWNMTDSAFAGRLSIDFFSIVVLFCIGMVSFISFLTAKQTVGDKKLNFTNLLMVIMLGMNGIAVVTDLFSLYVFLEITGIASFVLIALFKDPEGLEGAFKYLIMSAIASAFLLISMACIFMNVGSLVYSDVAAAMLNWQAADQPLFLMAAFIFFIAGICIKAGVAPFHGWLPDAYQSAPAPVSVLLGGIVTKVAGVYAIIRITSDVFSGVATINMILMILGTISIVFGAVATLSQKDFKRILAYSSISQIGYIVLGISTGSPIGFLGAVLHFFNHATFKTTLFVNSASLEKQVGTRDINEMGGLEGKMPLTNVSTILAFLSTSGIPPLAGFWSKLLIIIAVWQAGAHFVAGTAVFASVFTLAYFLFVMRHVFYGPLKEGLEDVKETKGSLALATVLLSIVTVGFGVLFPFVLRFLQAQGML